LKNSKLAEGFAGSDDSSHLQPSNSPLATRDGGKDAALVRIRPPVPWITAAWIAVAALLVAGCSQSPQPAPTTTAKPTQAAPAEVTVDDALVQFSLVAALAAGDYVDGFPLRELLAGGDFGVGTFSRLDGEMIVLDGRIYQALADGTIRAANLDGTTPFAAVTFFAEDGRIENFAAATLDDLDEQLDRKLPRRNLPYALRVDGEFTELTLRSVPAQTQPFQPLVEAVKHQVTWQHRNLRGTLVGLRCPGWIGTLNVAGYHWHFLSDDHKIGGHVLGCAFQNGSLRYDECTSLVIHLPQSSQFDAFDASGINKQDIDQIERQRAPSGRR
jgi:acetolactate decarboxylase